MDKSDNRQTKNKPKRLLKRSSTKENSNRATNNQDETNNSPPPFQSKLTSLFTQIETEFQKLHEQNSECKCFFILDVFSIPYSLSRFFVLVFVRTLFRTNKLKHYRK